MNLNDIIKPNPFYLTQGATLPSDSTPLKRNRDEIHPKRALTLEALPPAKRRLLFTDDLMEDNDLQLRVNEKGKLTLSINQKAILTPPTGNRSQLIKNHITSIIHSDSYLKLPDVKQFSINNTIETICDNEQFSEEDKVANLGILFYLIASQKEIPDVPSLIEDRIDEIILEIENLQNIHNKNCPPQLQEQVPSGCNAYLLRVFVRTIFPRDSSFNLGGCQAVKAMLNSSLTSSLSDEGRRQVLKVVSYLVENNEFRHYFRKSFDVTKEFEELIKIDNKLSKDSPFSFIYVRWALLLVFFSPICQLNQPNCYVVAAVANLINDTRLFNPTIKLLIDLLKTGLLSFEGKQISVSTLLSSKSTDEHKFNAIIPNINFSKMTGFSLIKTLLDTDSTTNDSTSQEATNTLNDKMELEYGQEAEYAKKIFISLKQVALQNALLAIFQFISLNISKPKNFSPYHSYKKEFIDSVNSNLTHGNYRRAGNVTHFNEFMSEFKACLDETLYFVDHWNGQYNIIGDRVVFKNHTEGLLFTNPESAYKSFEAQRRICKFDNGNLLPIDSLSDFQKYFLDMAEKIRKNNKQFVNQKGILNFIQYIKSNRFLISLANINYEANFKENKLPQEEYQKSNALFLIQNGGDSDFLLLYNPFKHHFHPPVIIVSNSASDFFNKISAHLFNFSNIDPNFKLKSSPWAFFTTSNHAFNLCPYLFKEYWRQNNEDLLNKYVTLRAKNFAVLTESKKLRILDLADTAFLSQELCDELCEKQVSLKVFDNYLRLLLPAKLHNNLNDAVDIAFNEISTEELKEHASALISTIIPASENLDYNDEIESAIQSINENINYINFNKISTVIHDALLLASPCVYKPINKIEDVVRDYFSAPRVVRIANLNWVTKFTEKLNYMHLVIKYDYLQERLVFAVNPQEKTYMIDNDFINALYNSSQLYFGK